MGAWLLNFNAVCKMIWPFAKYDHCLSERELFSAVTAFVRSHGREEPNTLLVDVDVLYKWAKLSSDCFCNKI